MTEHVFRVRPYQAAFHRAWVSGKYRRLIQIAHRRWGKDEIALHAARDLSIQRPASYWHCLPEYGQGRKALWTAINPHTGRRRIDEVFPPEVVENKDEQAMFLRLKWGATWQIIGADRFDSLVGAGVAGVTFSEWALSNPSAWGYIRPMLEENGGWASFITTPRGNNHCKAMFDMARESDNWFAELQTVDDTGALSPEQLAEALDEYQALYGADVGRALFEQEYYCSFAGALVGAYWGAEINKAEREGRIGEVEIDWSLPVHTAWDLSPKGTNNPIWCFQVRNNRPVVVDFYQPESDDLGDWCKWLADQGYHGHDYVPHDILATEWGTGRTRYDILKSAGRKPKRIARVAVADGLQAGRETINVATFSNAPRVLDGIEGLRNYRREWDDERKVFRDNPVKDWAEHIGSAFRYLGLAWREVKAPERKPEKPSELQYQVDARGRVQGNMSVREAVDAMVRRRRAAE